MLTTRRLTTVLAFGFLVFIGYQIQCMGDDKKTTDPFEAWYGKWKGVFKVYKPDGTLNTRLNVTQTYTKSKDGSQRAFFVEIDQQGRKTTAKARNWVKDGVLICEVKKSDGSESHHTGKVLKDGGICWYIQNNSKIESFFERVIKEGKNTYYVINGFGIYGKDQKQAYYFEGRYKRIEAKVKSQ